jgi:hypothetical protein
MRSLLSFGVAVIGLGLAVACAAPPDDAGPGATVSAYTVESGSRFVVSATPRHIVPRKHAGGAAFPFDKASLAGKALLIHIHPIARDAATGVADFFVVGKYAYEKVLYRWKP